MDLGETLAAAVRAERAAQRLTQDDLAARLGGGWSRDMISVRERGITPFTVPEIAAVCRALGVHLDDLLREADPADRDTLTRPAG